MPEAKRGRGRPRKVYAMVGTPAADAMHVDAGTTVESPGGSPVLTAATDSALPPVAGEAPVVSTGLAPVASSADMTPVSLLPLTPILTPESGPLFPLDPVLPPGLDGDCDCIPAYGGDGHGMPIIRGHAGTNAFPRTNVVACDDCEDVTSGVGGSGDVASVGNVSPSGSGSAGATLRRRG
jgi:hypothetical protein